MFRKRERKGNVRQKRELLADDDEGDAPSGSEGAEVQGGSVEVVERLADRKAMQELRKRGAGLDAKSLLKRKGQIPGAAAAEEPSEDPAGPEGAPNDGKTPPVKYGLQHRKRVHLGDDAGPREDPNMEKFVQQELARRRGEDVGDDAEARNGQEGEYCIPEELRGQQAKDVVIPGQWLTGIQEVATSADAKLRMIERTEAAKNALLNKAKGGGGVDADEDQGGPPAKIARRELPKGFGRAFGRRSKS
ncbi:unnamed protein product [Pedinophyceae sp. YPF-701]|nr:unnamed protein product [Pedinophyceae sp. YPF-701]